MNDSAPKLSVFTINYHGITNELRTPCHVSEAFDPDNPSPHPPMIEFQALWDTGATMCAISQRVVDACSLPQSGVTRVSYANVAEAEEVPTFVVNLLLPNQVGIRGVSASLSDPGVDGGLDVLIGMNVMSLGDYAISNYEGETKFSFRVPSQAHFDFVQDFDARRQTHLMTQIHREKGSTTPKKGNRRRRK